MAIVIKTLSDSSQAKKDLGELNKSVQGIQKSTEGLAQKFSRIGRSLVFGAAATAATMSIIRLSDSLTTLRNNIILVTDTNREAVAMFENVRRISIRTRTALESTANLYTKMSMSASNLGASQAQIARVTELVNMSFKGADPRNAQMAITQLSQAFAAGKLAGDEFRSVMENAPFLAKQIAEGMGATLGEMYKLRDEGKLLARDVFGAILKQGDLIEGKFKRMRITFGEAFTNMGNAITLLYDSVLQAFTGSDGMGLAAVLNSWAESIANFASRFEFHLLKAQTTALVFVIDVTNFFVDLWKAIVEDGPDAIVDLSFRMRNRMEDFIRSLQPMTRRISDVFLLYSSAIYMGASGLFFNFLEWLRKSDLTSVLADRLEAMNTNILDFARRLGDTINTINFRGIYDGLLGALTAIYDKIANFDFSAAFTMLYDNIRGLIARVRAIDVGQFFPSLDQVTRYVKYWVQEIASFFAWLYKVVIGNSYIPDLVKGTGEWMKKLMDRPLDYAKEFAVAVAAAFALIGPGKILPSVSLLAHGALFGGLGLGSAYLFRHELGIEHFFDTNAERLMKGFNSLVGKLDEVVRRFAGFSVVEAFEDFSKWFTRDIEYMQRNELTGSVERKTYLRNRNAPFMDRIHIPREWQAEIAVAIAGIASAALFMMMNSGGLRTVVMSLFTSAMLAGIARSVDAAVLREFVLEVGNAIISLFQTGIELLLGAAVSEDPFGFVSLVAKTSLLFEKGRAYFLAVAGALAFGPMGVGGNAANLAGQGFRGAAASRTMAREQRNINRLDNRIAAAQAGALPGVNVAGLQGQRALAQDRLNTASQTRANARQQISTMTAAAGQTIRSNGMQAGSLAGGVIGAGMGLEYGQQLREFVQQSYRQSAVENLTNNAQVTMSGRRLSNKQAEQVVSGDIEISNLDGSGQRIAEEIVAAADAPEWLEMAAQLGPMAAGMAISSFVGSLAVGGAIFVAQMIMAAAVGVAQGAAFRVHYYATIAAGIVMQRAGLIKTAAIGIALMLAGMAKAAVVAAAGFVIGLIGLPAFIIAAFVAAVVAIGVLLYVYWDELKAAGAWVAEKFLGVWEWVKDMFFRVIDAYYTLFATPKKLFLEDIPDAFRELFASLKDNLPDWMTSDKPEISVAQQEEEASRFVNDPYRNGQSVGGGPKYASGGFVSGPGTGTSDSIPARLSNGEFVVNAAATARNRGLLEAINDNKVVGFNEGGLVGEANYQLGRARNAVAEAKTDWQRQQAERLVRQWERYIARLGELQDAVDQRYSMELGKGTQMSEDGDEDVFTFQEGLDKVNELFPALQLSMEDYIRMSRQNRDALLDIVRPIMRDQEIMEDAPAGSEIGAEAARSILNQVEENRGRVTEIANSGRSQYSQVSGRLANAGLEMSAAEFQMLSPDMVGQVMAWLENQERWAKMIEDNPMDAGLIRRVRTQMVEAREAMDEALEDYPVLSRGTDFERLMLRAEDAGVNITRDAYNRLSDAARERLSAIVDRIIALEESIDNNALSEAARLQAQGEIDAGRETIDDMTAQPIDKSKQAGENFATAARRSFVDGMTNFMKTGKFSFLDVVTPMIDSLMNSFFDSIFDKLTGGPNNKNSIFHKIGQGSVMKSGGGLFGGSSGGKENVIDESGATEVAGDIIGKDFNEEIEGAGGLMGEDFGSSVGGLFGGGAGGQLGLAAAGGSLIGMLIGGLFKDGGEISGPGTGTSDSILARVSNGEFIVKQRQAKKFLPLLHAINDDNLPAFAEGGMVGESFSDSTRRTANIRQGGINQQNNTTQHLQIVGDISRQTRKQIYEMLPEIAAGVNEVNRERGAI